MARLKALFEAAGAAMDVNGVGGVASGKRWRRVAGASLSGLKAEKQLSAELAAMGGGMGSGGVSALTATTTSITTASPSSSSTDVLAAAEGGDGDDGALNGSTAALSEAASSAPGALLSALQLLAIGGSCAGAVPSLLSSRPGGWGADVETAPTASPAALLAAALSGTPPSTGQTSRAALRAIVTMCDLRAPDLLGAPGAPPPSAAVSAARSGALNALGAAGVFRVAVTSLSAPSLSDDAEYTSEVLALLAVALRAADVTVSTLGLDKRCLGAVQGLMRRSAGSKGSAALLAAGARLVARLEEVYSEQNGRAFGVAAGDAADLVRAAASEPGGAFHRFQSSDGTIYYSRTPVTKPGAPSPPSTAQASATQWDSPPSISAMMVKMCAVDRMSRVLEDDAVQRVEPGLIAALCGAIIEHAHDPGVVGAAVGALGKLAACPDNHGAILDGGSKGVLPSILSSINNFPDVAADGRVAEGFAALAFHLSFNPTAVTDHLAPTGAVRTIISISRSFLGHFSTWVGSPLAWQPPNVPDHNARVAALLSRDEEEGGGSSSGGQESPEDRARSLPRVAQMCFAALANIACDNKPSPLTNRSAVDELMDGGAIPALAAAISTHEEEKRLMEDSLCALSNMAYVSDGIQVAIGRACMGAVTGACGRFNGDTYLFDMTLRAIGNLTRADENILRAAALGGAAVIVEGMGKHAGNPKLLKLCADVLGNMSSISLPRDCDPLRILREAGGGGAGGGKGPLAGAIARLSSAGALVPGEAGDRAVKEAVCSILFEEGAAGALLSAVLAFPSDAELAASSLRALHYICSAPSIAARAVEHLSLPRHVVYLMQCNDTSVDVLARGSRILWALASAGSGAGGSTPSLLAAVVEARPAPVLFTAIEAHPLERSLCLNAFSVLALLGSAVCAPCLAELNAAVPLAAALRALADAAEAEVDDEGNAPPPPDEDLTLALLELLTVLCEDSKSNALLSGPISVPLADLLAARLAPGILAVATSGSEVASVLSLIGSALSFAKGGSSSLTALVTAGVAESLVLAVSGVADARATAPLALLTKDVRKLLHSSLAVLGEMVEGCVGGGVAARGAGAEILRLRGGPILEALVAAYRSVPDQRTGGTLVSDSSTCKATAKVLKGLVACGYVLKDPSTLKFLEGGAGAGGGVGDVVGGGAGGSAKPLGNMGKPPAATKPSASAPTEAVAFNAGGGASAPPNPALPPLSAAAEESVLIMAAGAVGTLWLPDGKHRKVFVSLSAQRTLTLKSAGEGGDATPTVGTPLSALTIAHLGNPAGLKKSFFGRTPKGAHSIVLELPPGRGGFPAPAHLEFEEEKVLRSCVAALRVLAPDLLITQG